MTEASQKFINRAAWQGSVKGSPLEVGPAPYTAPPENHIVIRNKAVAINPVDRFVQDMGNMIFNWLKFPLVPGSDVAGEVVEVGTGATRFKVGDRVVGMALGITQTTCDPKQGAFQDYVLLSEDMTSPIPDFISYEDASVLPLAISTAACGLYQKEYLNLPLPSVNPTPQNSTLIIWGGSTSIGCIAIQLAKSSGYEVITTCSPRNFDLVKKLGAAEAFDYNSKTVQQDIVKYMNGKVCAGTVAIGDGSVEHLVDIMRKLEKVERKTIAMISPPVSPASINGVGDIVAYLAKSAVVKSRLIYKQGLSGIKTNFIFGSDLAENHVDGDASKPTVGKAIYAEFLGDGLAQRKIIPSPEALIVETKGLEGIQEAYELQKKGVSAKKIVVTL